jgi:hypothetical protein
MTLLNAGGNENALDIPFYYRSPGIIALQEKTGMKEEMLRKTC